MAGQRGRCGGNAGLIGARGWSGTCTPDPQRQSVSAPSGKRKPGVSFRAYDHAGCLWPRALGSPRPDVFSGATANWGCFPAAVDGGSLPSRGNLVASATRRETASHARSSASVMDVRAWSDVPDAPGPAHHPPRRTLFSLRRKASVWHGCWREVSVRCSTFGVADDGLLKKMASGPLSLSVPCP